MKVYHHIDEFHGVKTPVLTTGTFDGVHIGHRTIINRLKEVAKRVGGETVLLTFFPHPRMVLHGDEDLGLINTQEEKIKLLEEAGIDHLIIHPFSKEFSRLSSLEYVRDIIANQINVHTLVIGYNHHFGRNREGAFEHLKEYAGLYGFKVEEIPAQEMDSINVSSTKIRNALNLGQVDIANRYLNSEFQLTGTVIKGDQLGRTIGYPTANIEIKERYKLIPAKGVYAAKVKVDGTYYTAMLNIGNRPTVKDNGELRLEVHILDFAGDLYGLNLTVNLLSYRRKDITF
ncbi:MAG: riboflavin kinase/FMN adenylyltransferase, partial [Flavobacteriales bacterium]